MTTQQEKAEVGELLAERAADARLGLELPPDKLMLLKRLLYRLGWTNVKLQRTNRRRNTLLKLARRFGVKRYARSTPDTIRKLAEAVSKDPNNEALRHAYADAHESAGNTEVAQAIRNPKHGIHFFMRHGYGYENPIGALSLAKADAHLQKEQDAGRLRFVWDYDQDYDPNDYEDPEGQPPQAFVGMLQEPRQARTLHALDPNDHRNWQTINSLGGVTFAAPHDDPYSDPYHRVVQAELMNEHMPEEEPKQLARKGQPLRMAKVDSHVVAHPLVQGFPIETALRHLANDPNNHPSIRELAKVAVTGGKSGDGSNIPMALWALHDEMHTHKHPAKDWYNWMSAGDKIGLDQHTYKAMQEESERTRYHAGTGINDPNRDPWYLTPEHMATEAARSIHPLGWVHQQEHRKAIRDRIHARVMQLSPQSQEKDIDESIRRHAHRAMTAWATDNVGIIDNRDHSSDALRGHKEIDNGPGTGGTHAILNEHATRYSRLLKLARKVGLRRYAFPATNDHVTSSGIRIIHRQSNGMVDDDKKPSTMHQYTIKPPTGKPVDLMLEHRAGADNAFIHWIGTLDGLQGGQNSIGLSGMHEVQQAIKLRHPEVKTISGVRVGRRFGRVNLKLARNVRRYAQERIHSPASEWSQHAHDASEKAFAETSEMEEVHKPRQGDMAHGLALQHADDNRAAAHYHQMAFENHAHNAADNLDGLTVPQAHKDAMKAHLYSMYNHYREMGLDPEREFDDLAHEYTAKSKLGSKEPLDRYHNSSHMQHESRLNEAIYTIREMYSHNPELMGKVPYNLMAATLHNLLATGNSNYPKYDDHRDRDERVVGNPFAMSRKRRVNPSKTEGLKRYKMVAGDFMDALQRIRSSDQEAVKKSMEEIAAKLGARPASTVSALHDSPNYSVPGVAMAIYSNLAPEKVHALAAWAGLTGNIPGNAVFHVRPNGPDMLHRFRMQGSGHELRSRLDKAGLVSRILIPHRTGFDVMIPDKGGALRDRVKGFVQQQKTELQTSRGHFKTIGSSDQAKAREMFRNTITKQEQGPIRKAEGGVAGPTDRIPPAGANQGADVPIGHQPIHASRVRSMLVRMARQKVGA